MGKIHQLYTKYKDVIPYLFFGVCTTAVNVVVYWLLAHVFYIGTMVSTLIAWVSAVLFAYITNRKWVFFSKAETGQEILREMFTFFGCRVATGVVDWGGMFILVEVLGLYDVVIKFLCNVMVIVLNYIASKLIIFKK